MSILSITWFCYLLLVLFLHQLRFYQRLLDHPKWGQWSSINNLIISIDIIILSHRQPCQSVPTIKQGIFIGPLTESKFSSRNAKLMFSRDIITVTASKGPVSRKSRDLFGPLKPFQINLYLKTVRCVRLKLLVWREPLILTRICE